MAFNDDLDIPVDVVLEGEFASTAPALVASAAVATLAVPDAGARAQVLERLLTQVRERRRRAA